MFLTPSQDFILATTLTQFPDEQPSSGTTTQGVDGSPATGTEVVESPFGGSNFFTFLMLLLVGMIVFSLFSGRKQKKRRAAMLDTLQKRDTVLTRGGVFGTIVEVKPDRVILKVDESSNTRITVLRDSIEQVTTGTPAE
jgi:preprotein translocase subunit YajC